MNTRKAVVGAAAVLAASLGGVATASTAAAAQPQGSDRISSIEQLKTSIQHAVAVEAQSTTVLAGGPFGQAGA